MAISIAIVSALISHTTIQVKHSELISPIAHDTPSINPHSTNTAQGTPSKATHQHSPTIYEGQKNKPTATSPQKTRITATNSSKPKLIIAKPAIVEKKDLSAGQIIKLRLDTPNKLLEVPLPTSAKTTAIVFETSSPTTISYALKQKPDHIPPHQLTTIKINSKTEYNTYISPLIQIPKTDKNALYIQAPNIQLTIQLYTNTNGTLQRYRSFLSTSNSYNQDKTSGAKYSTLPIIPRIVWGANPHSWDSHSSLSINDPQRLYYDSEHHCRWLPEYYRAQRIVIHHTVTRNYPNDPYRAVREIYLYHAYSRGWHDIGYNFLIDSNGRIFEGKIGGEGTKGYHAFEAANDMSIGIALIGNFTNTLPTSAQREALKKLIAEKATLFGFDLKYGKASLTKWLDPTYTVFGHRDSYKWVWDTNDWTINNTACPGQKFYNSGLLYQITSQAQEYKQTHFDQIKQAHNQALAMLNELEDYDYIPALELTLNVDPSTPTEQVKRLLPRFSGIKSIRIRGNKVYISVQNNYDNGYCGYIVPPKDWTGYDDCGSHGCMFFPKSEGAVDRLRELLTIFYLDPNITNIRWYNLGEMH